MEGACDIKTLALVQRRVIGLSHAVLLQNNRGWCFDNKYTV